MRPLREAVGMAQEAVRKAEEKQLPWDALLEEEVKARVRVGARVRVRLGFGGEAASLGRIARGGGD